MAELGEVVAELKTPEANPKVSWDGDLGSGLCCRSLLVDDDNRVVGYTAEPDCDGEVDYGTLKVSVGGVKFTKTADENLFYEESWQTSDAFEDADDGDFEELEVELEKLLNKRAKPHLPDFESFTGYQWTKDDIADCVKGWGVDYHYFAKNAAGDVFAYEDEPDEQPEGLEEISDDQAIELLAAKNLDWELF